MFERILIPTDGSESARIAEETGIELAREHGAAVHGLFVVEPFPVTDTGTGHVIETVRGEGKRAVTRVTDRAESEGLEAVSDVRDGTPHEGILEYVEANDVDLVVMGTHGKTGLDKYLLGSVSQKVVQLADVPVLTVPTSSDTAEHT